MGFSNGSVVIHLQCKRHIHFLTVVSQGVLVVKNSPTNTGDISFIPGSGRYPGVGNGNPLQ